MSEPGSLVERLWDRGRYWTVGDTFSETTAHLCDLAAEALEAQAAQLSTLREQAAHFAGMSNRDALAALKLESERDALRARCETANGLVLDAYKGILVLRTMCKKEGLSGAVEASDQLLRRMAEHMPELPALSALRATQPSGKEKGNG